MNAAVEGVGNIDVALGVDSYAQGMMELARFFTLCAAPLGLVSAFGVEFLDALIGIVSDIDVTGFIDGDPIGEVELALFRARPAPLGVISVAKGVGAG